MRLEIVKLAELCEKTAQMRLINGWSKQIGLLERFRRLIQIFFATFLIWFKSSLRDGTTEKTSKEKAIIKIKHISEITNLNHEDYSIYINEGEYGLGSQI